MYKPLPSILPEFTRLAQRALSYSNMDCVGLYRFSEEGEFDCGVIEGMPEAFVKRYEVNGIPIDPILAEMRKKQAPVSTETILGDRWQSCVLFRHVSGAFGIKGFAAIPLFDVERLAGVLYLGALKDHNVKRLGFEGICNMTSCATQISTALMRIPRHNNLLTPRQNEVARLADAGFTNRKIAEVLGTGEAAVRKHLKTLNVIFSAHNRTEMAARWRSEALVH
jgi:DNA-binding CsgD family transcriptional regulator